MFNWLQKLTPDHFVIRAKIQNDPFYRFQSLAEIQIAAELGIKIDVNQASVDDWLRLPGISIHQARSLVNLVGIGVQLLCLEDIAAALSVPIARIKPWAPILHFCYYDHESLLSPQRVNPNTASLDDLTRVPIIDVCLATAIIENRVSLGIYRNLADLQQRLAIDSQLVSQLMYYLQF